MTTAGDYCVTGDTAKSDALELSHDGAGAQVPRHHQLSKSRGSSSDLAIGACSVCVAESPGSAQR